MDRAAVVRTVRTPIDYLKCGLI